MDKAYNGVIWIGTHPREHRPDNDNPHIQVQDIVENDGKRVQEITNNEHNYISASAKIRFRPAPPSLTTRLLWSATAFIILSSGFLPAKNIDDSDSKVKVFH